MWKSAELPLHHGKAPRWLFSRMVKLSRYICEHIIDEYGHRTLLERLSDPKWFQSFACVLGFDWHSSGTTTTTMGALKEASRDLDIKVAGGKGKVARRTPEEIEKFGDELGLKNERVEELKYISRIAAKIDNCAVQDGYTLYHHTIVFCKEGWCVIQQGMKGGWARRYHWFEPEQLTLEPHSGIFAQTTHQNVLDLTSKKNEGLQKAIVQVIDELKMPRMHPVVLSKRAMEQLKRLRELDIKSFEQLLNVKGVGFKTLRALALTAKVVYGKEIDWTDPALFSFAHGGKDGYPFPVDRQSYEKTIQILKTAIEEAKIGREEKRRALKRLYLFVQDAEHKPAII